MKKAIVKPIQSDTILVPTDFTEVADSAIDYAIHLAKIFDRKIALHHVVEKGLFDKKSLLDERKNEVQQKLSSLAERVKKESSVECETKISVGSIFNEIGNMADEINASLIVMGTHGVKGVQHIFGSKALKVITNSTRPYVVVQKKPLASHGFKNIVLPIDFSKETKQKVFWARELAEKFNSNFYILAEHESDEFAANAVRNNLSYARNYLLDSTTSVQIKYTEKGSDFEKETMRFAKQVNADLIIIMTNQSKDLKEYVVGAYERNIIANEEQIPVMTLNPVDYSNAVNGHLFNFSNY